MHCVCVAEHTLVFLKYVIRLYARRRCSAHRTHRLTLRPSGVAVARRVSLRHSWRASSSWVALLQKWSSRIPKRQTHRRLLAAKENQGRANRDSLGVITPQSPPTAFTLLLARMRQKCQVSSAVLHEVLVAALPGVQPCLVVAHHDMPARLAAQPHRRLRSGTEKKVRGVCLCGRASQP